MSVLARNSTEKIKLPSGKTVHIPKCVTCFPLWCGEPITNTYGGKAVLTFRGKPLFAELLAILEAPDPSFGVACVIEFCLPRFTTPALASRRSLDSESAMLF